VRLEQALGMGLAHETSGAEPRRARRSGKAGSVLALRYSFLCRVRIFSGVTRLIANHPHLAVFESAPEVRALCSAGIARPRRSYDPVRLPPWPSPVASVTADHSANRASSKRIVSARIVMPIIGAIELRDLLTQLIDALTEQGVITSEAPLPTIVTPPGRPH
jgi:hypothetical protein